MVRIKKIALAALVAFALAAGGVATAEPPTYQLSFIDDEEIIEQIASSQGDQAVARESSVASSAGGRSSAGRESASLPTQAEELQQIAGSKGEMAGAGRDSSILSATPEELHVASAPGCGKPPVASACRESS